MTSFTTELNQRLATLREQHLFRELRSVSSAQGSRIKIGEKAFLNFSANDYLGLANHPTLKAAAIRAVEKYGAGAGAARLISGSLAPFDELETALAAFKKTEAALTFSTGYAAALGTITSLVSKADVIVLDKLVHACIVDAAKLSGAKLRVFDHNDLSDLEKILQWAVSQSSKPRILIVTESIFSMDGDAAPLREIVELKNKFGAWLMVDEAHATGIIGRNGAGLAGALGVSDEIEIQMGTLGKALGASGGYICGSRSLINFLVNRARSFVFSTAPVPAAAAAALAGIQLAQSVEGESRREQLRQRVAELISKFKVPISNPLGAIIPLILGDETAALIAAQKLLAQNIFVPAIRFPTVARGTARLRLTLSAEHSSADISELVKALADLNLENLKPL